MNGLAVSGTTENNNSNNNNNNSHWQWINNNKSMGSISVTLDSEQFKVLANAVAIKTNCKWPIVMSRRKGSNLDLFLDSNSRLKCVGKQLERCSHLANASSRVIDKTHVLAPVRDLNETELNQTLFNLVPVDLVVTYLVSLVELHKSDNVQKD